MSKGTPLKDHTIHTIKLFNKMEILEAEINEETQVDMVLETLVDSFKQFKLNYYMTKMATSLNELIRELHVGLESLKARYNLTKLDFTVLELSL